MTARNFRVIQEEILGEIFEEFLKNSNAINKFLEILVIKFRKKTCC